MFIGVPVPAKSTELRLVNIYSSVFVKTWANSSVYFTPNIRKY